MTLKPIMMGDHYRAKSPPRVFIASTTTASRGEYWEIFNVPERAAKFELIHVPITSNPDCTSIEGYVEAARGMSSDMQWEVEYLAEFPSDGAGIFPPSMVHRAQRSFRYEDVLASVTSRIHGTELVCTIGVDWNKDDRKGHGTQIVVMARIGNVYRVVYREEIKKSQFSLTRAVQRIIN